MIELTGVTKRFGNKTAVDGVTFTVNKGEIVGFLGPNGAGKTTTMRILTGFFPPTEGTVKIAGFDVALDPVKVKEKIGYMPENVPVYKELSVYDYLKFVAGVKGIAKDKIEGNIEKASGEAGITEVMHSIIGKLSKGFRQRVGLAQAILNDPEVLILDEPTAGLDPKQIKEIRTLIKNMKGDRTIILSTHILPEVSMTCDKVIVINEGRIIAQDNVEGLSHTFNKGSQIQVEAGAPVLEFIDEIKKINGVIEVVETSTTADGVHTYTIDTAEDAELRNEIVKRIVNKRWDLFELTRHQLSLEDVFLRLVTKEEE
jgi:ABC-2 type transport system ATP-binding protein